MTIREYIILCLLCICLGLLIGLRQQHKQKDYMIKILIDPPIKNSDVEVVNLPRIGDLK